MELIALLPPPHPQDHLFFPYFCRCGIRHPYKSTDRKDVCVCVCVCTCCGTPSRRRVATANDASLESRNRRTGVVCSSIYITSRQLLYDHHHHHQHHCSEELTPLCIIATHTHTHAGHEGLLLSTAGRCCALSPAWKTGGVGLTNIRPSSHPIL